MPTNAGPWVRTDGHPFAPTIDELINNDVIYAPVRYDETGTLVTGNYFTGTADDGTVGGGHCNNWTDSTDVYYANFGFTETTTSFWTHYGGIDCDGEIRLLCFQTGTGGPFPALTPPAGAKRVFVTSTPYNGNLGGLSGANTICQQLAQDAGLDNSANYKAWISDSATSAITNITSDGPWYRLDGVKVADTRTDLFDGNIFTAISQTETGAYVSGAVWTGTNYTGAGVGAHCNDWTDATDSYLGWAGIANLANTQWSIWSTNSCNNLRTLYCFED